MLQNFAGYRKKQIAFFVSHEENMHMSKFLLAIGKIHCKYIVGNVSKDLLMLKYKGTCNLVTNISFTFIIIIIIGCHGRPVVIGDDSNRCSLLYW